MLQAPNSTVESVVVLMSYTDDILGLADPPHKCLEREILKYNKNGYRLIHVLPSKHGVISEIVKIFFLVITLTLWAPSPGETLIFERRPLPPA